MVATISEAPLFPFDDIDAIGQSAVYARLRQEGRLAKVRLWNGSEPWVVTRLEDFREVLTNTHVSIVPSHPGYPSLSPARDAVLKQPPHFGRMDPPDHTRLRRMLSKEFMLKKMNDLRPQIQQMVDDLIAKMKSKGPPADFVEAFALPLPSMVVAMLLGVPDGDLPFFQEYSKRRLDLEADPETMLETSHAILDYVRKLIEQRVDPAGRGDDIVSRLVEEQIIPGNLTIEDAVPMVDLLLMAGHETTANQIALGLLSLLQHPDQIAALGADPALLGPAVEEMLRFHSILHLHAARVATADIEVGGQVIRAGEGILALIPVANHDPSVFENPEQFNIERKSCPHVGFSFGVHTCLGQQLARAELQIVFSTIFDRLPGLRLATRPEDVPFKQGVLVKGLEALPVTW